MSARGSTWLAGAGAAVVAIAALALVLAGRGHRARGPSVGGPDDRPGSAIVEVVSVPAGARVWEDGRDRGRTPLALPVQPGRDVVIEVRREGFLPVRRTVTASAGEPVAIHVELVPVPSGFAPPGDAGVPSRGDAPE